MEKYLIINIIKDTIDKTRSVQAERLQVCAVDLTNLLIFCHSAINHESIVSMYSDQYNIRCLIIERDDEYISS